MSVELHFALLAVGQAGHEKGLTLPEAKSYARAAIAALRIPSPAMIRAAEATRNGALGRASFEVEWQAAIDEVLKS